MGTQVPGTHRVHVTPLWAFKYLDRCSPKECFGAKACWDMRRVVTYPKSSPVVRDVALRLPVVWKLVWMIHQRPAPCLPSPVQVKGKLLMRGGCRAAEKQGHPIIVSGLGMSAR